MTFYPSAGVENQDAEAFAIWIVTRIRFDVYVPILGGADRCIAELHIFGHRAFAEGDNLEFFRMNIHGVIPLD